MYRISEELSNELKVNYIEKILRSLPEWFELEEGIKNILRKLKKRHVIYLNQMVM